jgi:tetratricopeptide (TPR) repeat protein
LKDEKSKKDEYQKALAAFTESMKDFRKPKYDKAAESFRVFIEKYPAERDLVARARTYLSISEEHLKEPRENFNPKTADDFLQAAVYKMNSGAVDEALKHIEKAVKLSPDDARILFLQADLLCRGGKLDEALEALRKAVQTEKTYRILAQNEIDFAPLWEDKRFKAITRTA